MMCLLTGSWAAPTCVRSTGDNCGRLGQPALRKTASTRHCVGRDDSARRGFAMGEKTVMNHQIIFEAEVDVPEGLEALLNHAITAALDAEQVDVPCEVNVLVTDDEAIHQINLDMRDVDRPTDVLSFPMFELTPGEKPDGEDADPATGLVPLGDMVLSLERAKAEEFGHSVEREISYLAVHSVLHLLGYDHMDEGEMKAQMRDREEAILSGLGITR